MKVLITGSSGLIGSEAVRYFDRRKAQVHGIDNNMRADFFGPSGEHYESRRFAPSKDRSTQPHLQTSAMSAM